MNPIFTIALQDDNRFFVQGMMHILRMHLTGRGYTAEFVTTDHAAKVDLIVRAESKVWLAQPCRLAGQEWRNDRAVIAVRDVAMRHSVAGPICRGEIGVLDRRDSPAVVVHLVERLLTPNAARSQVNKAWCERCSFHLTTREQEVLWAISEEMEPFKVAKRLKLSEKTVSSHKRAAMRKLGFRRNSELYHWLRKGGLNPGKSMES
ncbi:response regulator transcription factor [Serratia marcescens]